MPELPEVETVRRSLEARLLGATVERVRVLRRTVVVAPGDPAGGWGRGGGGARPAPLRKKDLLEGLRVGALTRHGKQLALLGHDASGRCRAVLLVHLGMTGRMVVAPGRSARPPHCHVEWEVRHGAADPMLVRFVDARRFGGLWVIGDEAVLAARWSALGPDGLSVRGGDLAGALGRSKRAIKAALLDQSAVAGVGNIYADEALFEAGISARRRCDRVREPEWETLAGSVREVLARAVEARGSTVRNYVDADGREGEAQAMHRVYGRGGLPCVRCGRALATAVIGQRTTVWCRTCQA